MENIFSKIKDLPVGTELWSDAHGKVLIETTVEDDEYGIQGVDCIDLGGNRICFNKYGQLVGTYRDAPCILWPDKENKDWDNFNKK